MKRADLLSSLFIHCLKEHRESIPLGLSYLTTVLFINLLFTDHPFTKFLFGLLMIDSSAAFLAVKGRHWPKQNSIEA